MPIEVHIAKKDRASLQATVFFSEMPGMGNLKV